MSKLKMVVSGAGVGLVAALAVVAGPRFSSAQGPAWRFQLEEATIDDVHRAIKSGQITCQGLVQAYLNRARAYNGVASEVVTEEMAPKYLPDYDQYKAAVTATAALKDGDPKKTPPIEFGRLEPTASDPEVQQQYGMVVGKPNAGQLRAMGMLNVRGERTVTCKGDRDRHPSKGALPAGSPAVCEELR
jgi:amidase